MGQGIAVLLLKLKDLAPGGHEPFAVHINVNTTSDRVHDALEGEGIAISSAEGSQIRQWVRAAFDQWTSAAAIFTVTLNAVVLEKRCTRFQRLGQPSRWQ